MDDRRLDRLEAALVRHAQTRRSAASAPVNFTAGVMRAVRQRSVRGQDFWDLFGVAARRFAPVGALAATLACGYAQVMERLYAQAVLSLSLHGGAFTLVGLMP
jgi:hypothetical protein